MLDCLKKITFLSLILSLFFLLGGCRNENDECQQVQDSLAFFIDFENECENSMWKNIRRIENDTAYSGKYVCECTPDMSMLSALILMLIIVSENQMPRCQSV